MHNSSYSFSDGVFRKLLFCAFPVQLREVLEINRSHTSNTEGRIKMLTTALIIAPRASIEQSTLIRSILEMTLTPDVAQKKTSALLMIDLSAALEAILIASTLSWPLRSSSRKRVVMRIA